ncbi:MAG: hypothetical protein JJT76_15475 [Clostridiaceae bacterium]|nr:hypothetical protein [Clostridiaceae bacterium]
MKKMFIIMLLIISMLTMVGFAPAETSYWESMKEIYEWNAMEGEVDIELVIEMPDSSLHYQIQMYSQTELKEMISYIEIEIEDMAGLQEIPTIKMYTHGSDLYLGTDAIVALLTTMGLEEDIDIQEEYVVVKNSDDSIQMNANILQDMLQFIEGMDLGIELGMTKEDNTYTLTLDSDKIIDLLDAYIVYFMNNMDKLPAGMMPPEAEMTEEEKQQALEGYNTFIAPQLEMVKALIAGSYYSQVTVFDEDAYYEEAELFITTPMGQMDMEMISSSTRLTSSDIQLPTSVKVITEEEFGELIMRGFTRSSEIELKAIIDLQGNYVKPVNGDVEEGKIELELKEGKSYITVEDAAKLLDITFEEGQESLWLRELENYGFHIHWNGEHNRIEIYQ